VKQKAEQMFEKFSLTHSKISGCFWPQPGQNSG